jgi:histone-binding protein RBBP4
VPCLPSPHSEVELPLEDTELDNRNYDDEKQQVGGFGTPHGKIHIKQQINHDGEVNRARWVLWLVSMFA